MTVYEKIDNLLYQRGMSRRELARKAGIKETTLASVFARQPENFPIRYLKPIAEVLGVHWNDLAGYERVEFQQPDRPPLFVGYDRPDLKEKLNVYGAISDGEYQSSIPAKIYPRMRKIYNVNSSGDFYIPEPIEYTKTCVIAMMDYLNQRGVMELFRYAGELTMNDDYLAANEYDGEAEEWQEDAPQTAAEPSPGSDLTDAGK